MIIYRHEKDLPIEKLHKLFISVGWESSNFPDKLKSAMLSSDTVISAWDNDELIGLMSAITDGYMNTFFPYLLINPKYQGLGIGKELVQNMLNTYNDCYKKILICSNEKAVFYEKCGMINRTDQSPMVKI